MADTKKHCVFLQKKTVVFWPSGLLFIPCFRSHMHIHFCYHGTTRGVLCFPVPTSHQELGPNAAFAPVDVTSEADVEAALKQAAAGAHPHDSKWLLFRMGWWSGKARLLPAWLS